MSELIPKCPECGSERINIQFYAIEKGEEVRCSPWLACRDCDHNGAANVEGKVV